MGGDAEIGSRAVAPLLRELLPIAAAHAKARQWAGQCIEAGCEDDDVQRMCPVPRADAAGHDLFQRRFTEIDEFNVIAIEGFEIFVVQRQPLGGYRITARHQLARDFRVLDHAADFFAHKVSGQIVGLLVEQQVAVAAEHPLEAAYLPSGLELLVAQFRIGLQRFRVLPVVGLADARPAAEFADLLDIALELADALWRQRRIARGDAETRRALEDGQMLGLLGDDRDRLDARGSGADHAHSLAGEINACVWPQPGVIPSAHKSIQTRNTGHLRRREAAHRGDQILGPHAFTLLGLDRP